jgi:hypothetical protein
MSAQGDHIKRRALKVKLIALQNLKKYKIIKDWIISFTFLLDL